MVGYFKGHTTVARSMVMMLLLLWFSMGTKAQEMTLSNNLLYDATLTPNLQLGVTLSPHWSMGVTTGFRPWPIGNLKQKKWRHLLISPEIRYWADSLRLGHFIGMNFVYSHFNAGYTDMLIYKGVKDERRQGDLVALGATYGYAWHLGRRWSLEAQVGLAVGYAWYDRFVINKQGDDWDPKGSGKDLFLLPHLGVNIVFHIPTRKRENNYITRLYE